MSDTQIDVVIADDQELVRAGFSLILGAQPGFRIVGEAADGVECVELARRLRPHVVLADIRMPRLDGLEVVRQLAGPDVADPFNVVMITTFDQDDYVRTALRNGACGFLLKDASPSLLVEAVQAAARGDALVSPAVTVRLLRQLKEGEQAVGESREIADLSERETDIVRLVAVGRTNQEICDELFLSLSTVKTYLGRIQSKLGARNRVEIAAWAWETGAVRPGR
ncbi:response regulator transcription factor [Streptomyces sp. AHA2]|uniref:response regulator transcription factor n=1 Tax=Streptomyces sp. AHA2 TaxID=3064526 RepID=UPI002FE4153D